MLRIVSKRKNYLYSPYLRLNVSFNLVLILRNRGWSIWDHIEEESKEKSMDKSENLKAIV